MISALKRPATGPLRANRPVSHTRPCRLQLRQTQPVARCRSMTMRVSAAAVKGDVMTLDTEAAQKSLRFAEVAGDNGGKAGIQPGQQVTAISDPNFPDQLLPLEGRSSKTGVTRSLTARISPTIQIGFGEVPKSLKGLGSRGAIVNELKKRDRESSSKVEISAARQEARQEYAAEQTGAGTNKNQFAGISALALFGIPLLLLAIAFGSGFMDQLSAGSSL